MIQYIENDYIYDIETFPNVFSFAVMKSDGTDVKVFEISNRNNDADLLLNFLRELKVNNSRLVGFNNLGFDYPVIHWFLEKAIKAKKESKRFRITANHIYKYAMKVIDSKKDGEFGIRIKDEDVIIKQVDLFKINHYDNKAKMTSLKLLEFNMRLKNIEDLPFPVGKFLSDDEIDVLLKYNISDIEATRKFYEICLDSIKFREDLSVKYNFDCTNLNDSKIGEQFFMRKIEAENPYAFYEPDIGGKKKMKQTKRNVINIEDCIFGYVSYNRPEFKSVLNWLKNQKITETKGVFSDIEEHILGEELSKYSEMVVKKIKFKSKPTESEIKGFLNEHPKGWIEEIELKATETLKDADGNSLKENYVDDKGKVKQRVIKVPKKSYYGCYNIAETLNVVIDDFRYDWGTGGIHGSVEGLVEANDEYEIWDWDVASFYPNMAIANRVYPEHLSESFCDSYEDFYNERGNYAKGTGENLAIKLGLNATYGNSNNQYSPFYDPKYTMTITINGQLSLCMLIERLLMICDVKVIQCNTDGFTVYVKKDKIELMKEHVSRWEKLTGLKMEDSHYSKMFIRDVNNYVAIYTNGKLKSKGAYEWKDLAWHKNMSALVIQMAVEHELLGNGTAIDFIKNHKDPYDFMLRAKIPRSSSLVLEKDGLDIEQQNICRYYPSLEGGYLVKIMPPLVDGGEPRRMSIESGWLVKTCNNMDDFNWDINYDYYIREAEKLLEPFKKKVYSI